MRLCAITDEVAPDFEAALRTCESSEIAAVEIRTVDGRNIVHHDNGAVGRVRSALLAGGFACPAVDTPFLKTEIGHAAPAWQELERGIEVAHALEAGIVRVFSGLRTPNFAAVLPWLVEVLGEALDRTSRAGLRLALEIEHVCNVATGLEAGRVLARLPRGSLGVVWDPGNEAMFAGAKPDPAGFPAVSDDIVHVHVKDVAAGRWVRVGSGVVDWVEQLRLLSADGYDAFLSLEPHYELPDGGLQAAARESADALRDVAAGAGVELR
jgi:L-ribulose-5-phosphate 3-epimerase